MPSPQGQQFFNEFFFKIKLVWGAMLGCVGAYIVITMVTGPLVEMDPNVTPMLEMGIVLAALGNGVVIFLLRNSQLTPDKINEFYNRTKGNPGFGIGAPGGLEISGADKPVVLLPYYFQSLIVTWAMGEAVAIYGLVLSFITGPTIAVAVLYMASAGLIARFQPKQSELQELSKAIRAF